MKKGSTLLLKISVFLVGAAVFALCCALIYAIIGEMSKGVDPQLSILLYSIFFVIFGSVIPFFLALNQAMKLLSLIDKNRAFSEESLIALKNISYCAILICALYVLGMPFVFMAAEMDDAPGLVLIALIIIFASFVVATFATLLRRLFQSAIEIKSENDLTV